MSTYAIGDVQGCFSSLQRLIGQIHFDPKKDRLWFVGDLVNRGPDSLAVLRFVKGLGNSAVTVLGNHDLHLLAVAEGIRRPHKEDTVQDVLEAPDRDDLLDWLRGRPLLHQSSNFVLVHAGLLPEWTVGKAAALAGEVENALRSSHSPAFLRTLYEGHLSSRWSDDLTGDSRLGLIAAILTRLRICTADGLLNFKFNDVPHKVPEPFLPWFQVPGRQHADDPIVCGHWAALGLHLDSNVMALDTGCLWGRKLTAMRLEDREVFQVSCGGAS